MTDVTDAAPILTVTDPVLAAAIGHAMAFCIEDRDVLLDPKLRKAAEDFYVEAAKLADSHPNVEPAYTVESMSFGNEASAFGRGWAVLDDSGETVFVTLAEEEARQFVENGGVKPTPARRPAGPRIDDDDEVITRTPRKDQR